MPATTTQKLLKQIRACTFCKDLPLGPRPVLNFSTNSKILIVGQAPGTAVHKSGVPWNDPSGDRLRQWMQVDRDSFYDVNKFSIVPMAYCYPGRGKGGDLPPRPECAELWLKKILAAIPQIELTILIGQYAQNYFLGNRKKKTLTETVQNWREYLPHYLPLPHPSPRNNIWLKKNKWFEQDVVPYLAGTISKLL